MRLSTPFTALRVSARHLFAVCMLFLLTPLAFAGDLINISSRCHIQSGAKMAVAGFIIEGSGTKRVLLRGFRTGLTTDPNFDLKVELMRREGSQWVSVASNDNWPDGPDAGPISNLAANLIPPNTNDAALIADLPPGVYTMLASLAGSLDGIGVVSVDDLDDQATATSRLTNISARCAVESGVGNAIAGFIISGSGTEKILLRGLRTDLAPFDPRASLVKLESGQWLDVEANDNWEAGPDADEIRGLPANLIPADPRDAAFIADLEPGVYTMLAEPVGAAGIGVVGVDVLNCNTNLNFTDIPNASPNTEYQSNAVTACTGTATVSGGGSLLVNGVNRGTSATVADGDSLAIQATSPASGSKTLSLSLNGQTANWTITVDIPPDSACTFNFTDLAAVTPDADQQSNTIEITQACAGTATLSGGLGNLIVNGQTRGVSATVNAGDTLAIQTTAPVSGSRTLQLTLGNQSESWTLTAGAIAQPQTIDGTVAGTTAVQTTVSEAGAALVSIPITSPSGSAGMSPNLAIACSSQGHNGLLGVGCGVSGLSAITRCPATQAQDGFIDGVDFDDNDRFCLDGERLMALQGVYGADGTVYYTEQHSFKKVVSHGSAGSGPERFTVWNKDGTVQEYAFTADARIEAQGRSDGSVLVWALNQVRDLRGNYLNISYNEDSTNGAYRPVRIDYTGNSSASVAPYASVQFHYGDRPDVSTSYVGGSLVKSTQRLVRVDTWEGADPFRFYMLNYEQSGSTQRSHLASVQECGTDGGCFAPTQLEWELSPQIGFAAPQQWMGDSTAIGAHPYSYSGRHEAHADVNGDGVADKLWVPNGRQDLWVSLSTKTGFTPPEIWLPVGATTGSQPHAFSHEGRYETYADLNGDGLADKLWRPHGRNDLWAALSNGTGFEQPTIWLAAGSAGGHHPYSGSGLHTGYGDLNGDGRTDIVWVPNGRHDLWVALSTGNGFTAPEMWLGTGVAGGKNPYSYSGLHTRYADFNGDGLTDMAWVPYGRNDLWVALSTGTGFTTPEMWLATGSAGGKNPYSHNGYHDRYADVNGDGLSDKVWVPYGLESVWVAISTGSGFLAPKEWLASRPFGNAYRAWSHNGSYTRYIDVNNDGRADQVWVPYASDSSLWTALSTGESFQAPQQLLAKDAAGGKAPFSTNERHTSYIDLNGDGIVDKVWLPHQGSRIWVALGKTETSVLKGVTNGHDTTTTFEYKPLTDPTIYTKGTDAQYPGMDFTGPVYVVSSVSTDNGVGGQHTQSYHYQGGKVDLNGRGFRGFSQVTVTDETRGIRKISFYERDHRYISTKLKREETRLLDGTLVEATDNQAELKDYGNGVHFSRIKTSTKTQYELDGSLVSTVTVSNNFDDYGNATRIETDYGNGRSDVTVNTFYNNTAEWILGRITQAQHTKSVTGQGTQTRSTAFAYTADGLLQKETLLPGHALCVEKVYSHDAFGNVTAGTTQGCASTSPSVQARTHRAEYDHQGRYEIRTVNALGHEESRQYHLGNLVKLTGPNGLTTERTYDGFGRLTLEKRADGTWHQNAYLRCEAGSACPDQAVYYLQSREAGESYRFTYYDALDRQVRSAVLGFSGSAAETIYSDTVFNAKGEVAKSSEPYFATATPVWTENQYDALSRLVQQTAPDGGVTQTVHHGLSIRVTNPLGQTGTRVNDVQGNLVRSTDAAGKSVSYIYDGFGNLLQMRDSLGNTTSMEYDLRGNKTRMFDPDTGVTQYAYNALGEVLSQTDAKGQTVTTEYDLLGRMVQRQEPEGTSIWTYDTAANGIGRLAEVSGPGGYRQSYYYDSFGREVESETVLNGQRFIETLHYDQYGRLAAVTYPSGFAVHHSYNSAGYLAEVRRADNNQSFWRADTVNARGQLEQVSLGNGLVTRKTYDSLTGRVSSIRTGAGNPASVQDWHFDFDLLGNLKQRRSGSLLVENFTYDNLNRLTGTSVNGAPGTVISYNEIGNISYKSDVGSYLYGQNGAGPHAVTQAGNTTYTYDANGNRVSTSDGQQIAYTSFNKPAQITQGGTQIEFLYGPTYARYQQTHTLNGVTTTTLYVSGRYEQESKQGVTKGRHTVFAGEEKVAVYTIASDGDEYVRYLHSDHLGSVDVVSDGFGDVVDDLSFDAWGQRRSDTWGVLTEAEIQQMAANLDITRGFTGHEHLDSVNLIHMNGRLYDPRIGRFLNADPFIQDPANMQNLNRYSYVLNNPLALTDPTGFFSFGKLLKKVGKAIWNGVKRVAKAAYNFVKDNIKTILVTAASVALGAITGGIGSALFGAIGSAIGGSAFGSALGSLAGTILSGAGSGFGTAFVGTLLSGGSLSTAFKAGLKGGLMGGAMAGLNSFAGIANSWIGTASNKLFSSAVAPFVAKAGQIIVNGVKAGLESELHGGKFGDSFLKSVAKGGLSFLSLAYKTMVGEDPQVIAPNRSADVNKGKWTPPLVGRLNFGIQGLRAQLCCHPLREGSPLTTFIGRYVPFMNAISGAHDYMQVKWTGRSEKWRNILNVPYMIPATLLTVGAYMGNHPELVKI